MTHVAILVSIFALISNIAHGQRETLGRSICRNSNDLPPHQASLWHEGFPLELEDPLLKKTPTALCEGEIVVTEDQICVSGRVTYKQISEAVGKGIYAPASDTISVNGHMVIGSANVILGTQARFLYDYIQSFELDGVSYDADSTIVDKLLVASRGRIDGFCLDASIATPSSLGYKITSIKKPIEAFDPASLNNANAIFIGVDTITVETWEEIDSKQVWRRDASSMKALNAFANIPVPPVVSNILPVLGLLGTLRNKFLNNKTFFVKSFPQPLIAPDLPVEDLQLDMEWEAFLKALSNGLFSDLPRTFGVFAKVITPAENTNGCWKSRTAAIDIQAPLGKGTELDDYVNSVVYPALAEFGTPSISLGKRFPGSSSDIVESALGFYESCGVEVDLTDLTDVENCYHPLCYRKNLVTTFQYPAIYYE